MLAFLSVFHLDCWCWRLWIFRSVLRRIYNEVRVVDVLDSGDTAHLAMMKRPDLGVTFTKLHCWTLTHYSKCVFMDADTLVSPKHSRCCSVSAHARTFADICFFTLGAFKYRWVVWQRRVVSCSWPWLAWLLQLWCVCLLSFDGDLWQTASVLYRTWQLWR